MKKLFEAKKPFVVLFVNGMFGERKIMAPFTTEKKLIDSLKEPFLLVEKGCFFMGEKIIPSAIKGGAPTRQMFAATYDNDIMVRTSTIGEISIVHECDSMYDQMKNVYGEIVESETKAAEEEKESK